jgi:hypothetical protein
MQRKRRNRTGFGFSDEKFLQLLSTVTGISPVGVLGRDTPLDLTSLEAARGSLLLREVYSKFDDGKPSKSKEQTTWKRFQEAEDLCRETNQVIPKTFRFDPFWRAVAMRVKKTLGEFSWDESSRYFSFGPGATTRLVKTEAAAAYKYSGIPESTSGNAILASCAIRAIPIWNTHVAQLSGVGPDNLVKVVPGNCVISVPKNYKTDRTIAKEPCMNIYVQKGIGHVIRNRLKRVGVDLNDQRHNQRAAREGSITGQLATIDLSMASDTVAFELVSFLLPNDWWFALEQSRSPVGVLPSGEILKYQKFSSMGNGYTFELETLIFWCICQCVCRTNIEEMDSRILVYGDDIVCPSDKADEVLRRLWQAGFKPNPNKTFVTGPYRESCGKHYFLGCDITPFYVRKPVQFLHRLFLVHNNVYRWGERTGVDVSLGLTSLKGIAPAKWREPRLPDGFGDGAFIGAVDELRLDSHPHGWDCWQIKVLGVLSDTSADDLPDGQLVASLVAAGAPSTPLPDGRSWEFHFSKWRPETSYGWHLFESMSRLPAREGRYVEIPIHIFRSALHEEVAEKPPLSEVW